MGKEHYLSFILRVFGIASLITAFGIPLLFGDLLLWTPRNLPTELMVGSLYFMMGIMMLVAACNPLKRKIFMEFVVHLVLDVGFIGIMGLVLLVVSVGIKGFQKH
jgi:hypothetical protein